VSLYAELSNARILASDEGVIGKVKSTDFIALILYGNFMVAFHGNWRNSVSDCNSNRRDGVSMLSSRTARVPHFFSKEEKKDRAEKRKGNERGMRHRKERREILFTLFLQNEAPTVI